MLELVDNEEKYYEFIRVLRTDKNNLSGFLENVEITPEQQKNYMEKYGKNYYITLLDGEPVGWVGEVDGDIRVCTDHNHKGRGIGKFMLNGLMERRPKSHAKVLLDNESSNKLFTSCGFELYDKDEKFNYYKK